MEFADLLAFGFDEGAVRAALDDSSGDFSAALEALLSEGDH